MQPSIFLLWSYLFRSQPRKTDLIFKIDQIFIALCPTLTEKSPNLGIWPSLFPTVCNKQHAQFENDFCNWYIEKCIYTNTNTSIYIHKNKHTKMTGSGVNIGKDLNLMVTSFAKLQMKIAIPTYLKQIEKF